MERSCITIPAVLCVLLFAGAGLAASSETTAPDPVRVEARVDKEEVFIGDRVRYSIDVFSKKPGLEVEFPQAEGRFGEFVAGSAQREISRWPFAEERRSIEYILTSYEPGSRVIEPLSVRVRFPGGQWREIKTGRVAVAVRSVLAGRKDVNDIRDIKDPLALRESRLRAVALIVAGFAAAWALAALLIRKIRSRGERIVIRPAHEIAYEELRDIKNRGLIAQGKSKEYFTRLSNCIRRYLENRFSLRAPEMTTEEFLGSVRESGFLTSVQKALLKEFLSGCDMVKFAKYGPAHEEIESSFQTAKSFVDQTKTVEEK